ncbi:hypothetical protein NBRC116590_03360 [Pelagimonas sp. KU-00592-HH]|uniref:hypothetical protein n=1 Tax=Pelagimonas sp. KU-00592-HH TaxID=3127651 RepID=UPI003102D851
MRRIALIFMGLAGMAQAEGWSDLNGAEIAAALNEQTLHYEDATQVFYESGRTLYDAGRPSWGYWAVRGDQYCSQWPPADGWACYDMQRNGDVLRFIGESGHATDGVLKR